MNLPVGYTLIAVIFSFDVSHLTNFCVDGKLWPVYMSMGNILSTILQKLKSHACVPIALHLVAPKRVQRNSSPSPAE